MVRCHIAVLSLLALVLGGCKDVVNPHSTPQGDPSHLVASMAANSIQAQATSNQAQVTLTLNNVPEANEPLEQDFITEIVELFEKRNPGIRIQYSPWQYTPDSFFERLNNRTLTDIIEVDAEQMAPIIDANAAADLTDEIKVTPEMQVMNPNVFRVTSRNDRTYGVPTELHTMALFYNRRLLDATRIVVPQASQDAPAGKGGEDPQRELVLDLPDESQLAKPSTELAQGRYYYPPGYQNQDTQSNRSQRSRRQSGQDQRQQDYQRRYEEYQRQYKAYEEQLRQYNQRYGGNQQPQANPYESQGYYGNQPSEDDARARRVKSRKQAEETSDTETADNSATTITDDILTTEAELALNQQQTSASDSVTSVIETADLPRDTEQFIRLAVRLTDHKKGIAGYGPVLFAREGGREYTQWSIQAGIPMQQNDLEASARGWLKPIQLSVNKTGDIAQFLKDMHWRFDATPMPDKCYYDNLINMFVDGKLGMMMLPADGNTLSELMKRGMPLNDIGIAALPRGVANRDHLTYGKCLIINTQLDKVHRSAAFKWLMFVASPEVSRLRAQFFHREKEMTAAPCVPLYSQTMQEEYFESIKNFRSLPRWKDYEKVVATNLHLEPAYETDRFYEAVAEGLRPVIEFKESDPYQAVKTMAQSFESKYVIGEKPIDWSDQLVEYIKGFKHD